MEDDNDWSRLSIREKWMPFETSEKLDDIRGEYKEETFGTRTYRLRDGGRKSFCFIRSRDCINDTLRTKGAWRREFNLDTDIFSPFSEVNNVGVAKKILEGI